MLAIGILQILAGAAIFIGTLGAGTNFASALINEGAFDIITAVVDCIILRDFSWTSYLEMKAVTFTTALITAGGSSILSAIKLLGKAV